MSSAESCGGGGVTIGHDYTSTSNPDKIYSAKRPPFFSG
ncbi:hypothetical protein A2U01_0047430, partial [Trifolium medium]|nr:hypothetical protein [Trifolium medium]